ncbi:ribulose-phosphate 3-epimerase [Stutzerimonas stutzeri]|uniref:Ribulose-phosphate 3-epimerase n=2 Tax=Stutzerimonas stutzeri TaxID=316 RepID=W8R1N0_STUST|nr:GFA family protein [Stutzerimonas stutzeri]AHL76815.1 ribulose-phosphate 3-epimerase [Stutzerimonas stutzeri]MCQ4330992.1 GFA family protein [Stutzerimonas stutzeri]
MTMHKGSCLCGAVSFELKTEPRAPTHCHCRMCQKQHGAAFASYASILKSDLTYLSGEDLLASYNSSASIMRRFCSRCGSNIEWSGSERYPDWVSITLASLDTPFKPERAEDVHLESAACWLAGPYQGAATTR